MSGPDARHPITRSTYSSVMGCRTIRPNWSSKNLTLVPAAIPCLRRSSAGMTSWPLDVNVPLSSFMSYIISHVRPWLRLGLYPFPMARFSWGDEGLSENSSVVPTGLGSLLHVHPSLEALG